MRFTIILDQTGLTYYGYIPNTPFPPDPRIDDYQFADEDKELLIDNFIDPMYELYGVLLDDGDVDYLDQSKCIQVKTWLEKNIPTVSNDRLKVLYSKLLDYVSRAAELGTGVVIEL